MRQGQQRRWAGLRRRAHLWGPLGHLWCRLAHLWGQLWVRRQLMAVGAPKG